MISFVLLVFAFVTFVVAAFVPVPRVNLVAAGLAFLAAAMLVSGLPSLG